VEFCPSTGSILGSAVITGVEVGKTIDVVVGSAITSPADGFPWQEIRNKLIPMINISVLFTNLMILPSMKAEVINNSSTSRGKKQF